MVGLKMRARAPYGALSDTGECTVIKYGIRKATDLTENRNKSIQLSISKCINVQSNRVILFDKYPFEFYLRGVPYVHTAALGHPNKHTLIYISLKYYARDSMI